jgi:hypothetical protein
MKTDRQLSLSQLLILGLAATTWASIAPSYAAETVIYSKGTSGVSQERD